MTIITVISVMLGIVHFMSEEGFTHGAIALYDEGFGNTVGEATLTDFDYPVSVTFYQTILPHVRWHTV